MLSGEGFESSKECHAAKAVGWTSGASLNSASAGARRLRRIGGERQNGFRTCWDVQSWGYPRRVGFGRRSCRRRLKRPEGRAPARRSMFNHVCLVWRIHITGWQQFILIAKARAAPPPLSRCRCESGLDRILFNIANRPFQMGFIANESVKIVCLPKFSLTGEQFIATARRGSLPTFNQS